MLTKYDMLDAFKLIAALFVIGIHAWPLPDVNSNVILFQGVGRFAVPFFLLTTGFLLQNRLKNIKEPQNYVFHYLKRLF